MKIIKLIIIVITLLILAIGVLVFTPIMINNIICNDFSRQLFAIPLPPQTSIISTEKYVGNLGPTGNHLDFRAVLEIETSLSEQEILAYYADILLKPANEVSLFKPKPAFFDEPDGHRDMIQVIVIRKNQSQRWRYGGYVETDIIDSNISDKLYIVQIFDNMYDPGWDMRAH